jgi:hypothetical protein
MGLGLGAAQQPGRPSPPAPSAPHRSGRRAISSRTGAGRDVLQHLGHALHGRAGSSESGFPVRIIRARTWSAIPSRWRRGREDPVPRLPEVVAPLRMAPPYRSPTGVQRPGAGAWMAAQAQVANDRGHQRGHPELAVADHAGGAQGHNRVAVHQLPHLVHDDHAVRVPVEGDADARAAAHDLGLHGAGMQRPAVAVDVHAVGLHADGRDPRPQLLEDQGGDAVCGAVSRVDHHAHPVEGEVPRERGLREDRMAAQASSSFGPARWRGPAAAAASRAAKLRPRPRPRQAAKPSPPKTLMPLSS